MTVPKIINLLIEQRSISLLIIILFFIIILSAVYKGNFFSTGNFISIFENIAYEAILACGVTILLIAGFLDLSVGAVLYFIGIITAYALKNWQWGIFPSILFGLFIAVLIGMFHGLVIAKIGVNSLIVTIATLSVFYGLCIVLTGTGIGSIYDLPPLFGKLGQTRFFGFNTPFWVMVILLIIFQYLLSKNKFFRMYYYIGENPIASIFCGLNISNIKFIAFIISSLLAGIVGILFASRNAAAAANIGEGAELRVITAVIIGGASLSGGKGSIVGSFFGVVFISIVRNAITTIGLATFWYPFITSLILLIAVIIDVYISRKRV